MKNSQEIPNILEPRVVLSPPDDYHYSLLRNDNYNPRPIQTTNFVQYSVHSVMESKSLNAFDDSKKKDQKYKSKMLLQILY